MKSCLSNINDEDLEVIGAGGFGTVYAFKSDPQTVIKAIYSKKACLNAMTELKIQAKIYNLINRVKQSNVDHPIVNLFKKYVIVSRPGVSCDKITIIKERVYECYFSMSRLKGVPLSLLADIKPKILDSFDKDFLEEIGMDFNIMVQLSYNAGFNKNIYGITYSVSRISKNNPPRGYFIDNTGDIVNNLRRDYNLELSHDEIKQIMGFIYGVIFFYGKMIPIDIEITLGLYNGEWKINVLDFGMVIDLSDLEDSHVNTRTQKILEIINNPEMSEKEKKEKIEEITLFDISIDLYCEITEQKSCIEGWKLAEQLFK